MSTFLFAKKRNAMKNKKQYSVHVVFNHVSISKADHEEEELADIINEALDVTFSVFEKTDLCNILPPEVLFECIRKGIADTINSINRTKDISYYLWIDSPMIIMNKKDVEFDEKTPYGIIINKLKHDENFYSKDFIVVIFDVCMFKKKTPSLILMK